MRDGLRREVARAKAVEAAMLQAGMAESLTEIRRKAAAMPVVNAMTDDEILGYDEFGVPTK
jgi:hypothetical protein